jgi:hypothetical protein
MFAAAQKPLHGQTKVSQLDAIGRIMALKLQYSLSRDAFDGMLTVIGSLLSEDHILPKSMCEAQKLLCALKMPYDWIHACPKGCVLFRKEYAELKYCPKCKASRFMEVASGDGRKRQLDIPVTILRHLPFIPRIQRLYMTEEYAKQMTWHKNGKRYRRDRMVHAFDGEAWTHFDNIHHEKAREARNVRVALATDGFNPYGMMAATYTCWPIFVIPLNLPPGVCFQRQNILVLLIIPGHSPDVLEQTSKCMFGTNTQCMTCWPMGYSTPGVFTGSSHAQYARKVLGSFGCRRVASIRRSTNIGNSSLVTMHSGETKRTS